MLYHLFGTDEDFQDSLKKIIEFYFPVASSPLDNPLKSYSFFDQENNRWEEEKMNFPFVDKFQEFFREKDPQKRNFNHFVNIVAALTRLIQFFEKRENIKSLLKIDTEEYQWHDQKQSKSREDFDQDPYSNLTYCTPNTWDNGKKEILKYSFRIFRLMVAVLLHDIGKTVIYPRHGLEGRIILGFHHSNSIYLLNEIFSKYNRQNDQITFFKDDLLFIAQLVNFHDCYGTMATGEDGYQQLTNVIEVLRRYSLSWTGTCEKRIENPKNFIKQEKIHLFNWSQRNLFDLWLLNIADILVSLMDKHLIQNGGNSIEIKNKPLEITNKINWWNKSLAESHIKAFFALSSKSELDEIVDNCGFESQMLNPQEIKNHKEQIKKTNEFLINFGRGGILVHDLSISFRLLYQENQKIHKDNLHHLQNATIACSQDHTVERIRRLLTSSINIVINDLIDYEYDRDKKDCGKMLDKLEIIKNTVEKNDLIKEHRQRNDTNIESYQKAINNNIEDLENEVSKLEQELDNETDQIKIKLKRMKIVSNTKLISKYQELVQNIQVTTSIQLKSEIDRDFDTEFKGIMKALQNLDYSKWNSSILRSIRCSGDFHFQEFTKKLALISKMDYSLGFFKKIVKRAIEKVAEEIFTSIVYEKILGNQLKNLQIYPRKTGWITTERPSNYEENKSYYYQIQAEALADNYATTVVQILSYLLVKYDFISVPKNLEFNDAQQRLTNEKIDKIINLEGPFRSHRAIELILQTISIY